MEEQSCAHLGSFVFCLNRRLHLLLHPPTRQGSFLGFHPFDLLLDACKLVFVVVFILPSACKTSFVSVSTECANCKYYCSRVVLFLSMFVLKNNSHQRLFFSCCFNQTLWLLFDERKSDSIHRVICSLSMVTIVLLQMALILASLELSGLFFISFVCFFFQKKKSYYCKCPLVYVSY